MKKLLICEENREEIMKNVIAARPPKATTNLIEWSDILDAKICGDNRVKRMLKRQCKGLYLVYSLNSKKAKAYKYKYQADILQIDWTTKGWIYSGVSRSEFWPDNKDVSCIGWKLGFEDLNKLKDELKFQLLESFMSL